VNGSCPGTEKHGPLTARSVDIRKDRDILMELKHRTGTLIESVRDLCNTPHHVVHPSFDGPLQGSSLFRARDEEDNLCCFGDCP
jgi:hypothetical protein